MTDPRQIIEAKRALRGKLRTALAAASGQRLEQASQAAAERVCATEEFQRASAVMIFLPLRYEIDARPIALRAWQSGKTVTVPLVNQEPKGMMPIVIRSLEEPMDCDPYGVVTPVRGQPFPPEMLDLVIVPGLGFDRSGLRIGRGGGFYDRFLSTERLAAKTCGLAIAEQIVDQVPREEHDVRLDMLATDEQLLRFAPSPIMQRS